MLHRSIVLPLAAAIGTAATLAVGYRYADLTHHRKPPPPPPVDMTWPGTVAIRGTLVRYNQRLMTIRSGALTFGIVYAQSTVSLPTCGRWPSLRPGEALEVRVPPVGNGDLLATMVRDAGPCPR